MCTTWYVRMYVAWCSSSATSRKLDPIPSRPANIDEDGNIRIPIWLTPNGRHTADTEMVCLPRKRNH